MSITLRDIARMANVSAATVSRVLNHKAEGNMRPETYQRITRIIKETGYTPHALASGLRTGFSKVVGVILPDNVNPYYAQLGKAVENECFKHGYMTLICNTNSDVVRERDYIRHLSGQRVSGILLCATGLSAEEIGSLVPSRTRIILLDEELNGFTGDVVVGDDFKGGVEAARYLLRLGHRRILVITGPRSLLSSRNRLKGFLHCTGERGIAVDNGCIVGGAYTIESAYNIVKEKLSSGPAFTAVFAFNDMMAIGTVKALNESGIRVPDDVSVLGYDNIFIDVLFRPYITTVAAPLVELGEIAVKRLLSERDDGNGTENKVLLEPKLVVRDSCAPLSY